jgi:Z1 domain-containing protein
MPNPPGFTRRSRGKRKSRGGASTFLLAEGIAYGNGLNFLIGGNTLGRGIAIRDLLVTYYVREAKVSQIDTMHQHARMYG